jgi:nitrite reductase/ring-hydroxylating ferredoxin subunit
MAMIFLCRTQDVPQEGGLRIELPNRPPVAVFRAAGRYFVTDDTCTHGEASLSEGEVLGTDIICPFHQGTFDLRDGRPTGSPCVMALRTYSTELRDGALFAALDAP